jgi:1-acyl-sn-glycerol-3-phosphate acyltransferase
VLRALALVTFWSVGAIPVSLIGFPWTLLSGRIDLLYGMAMRLASAGVRLAGAQVEVVGRERIQPGKTYIFMSNHASNIDPPLLIPLLPRRTSVLVKKELFRVPLLGAAMRMADLVAVDRQNRDAAIASVRAAAQVVNKGLDMTIFPEGTRSRDGSLLPFKKGPFYLAMESGVPLVPVTLAGTHEVWPKGRFAIRPGPVTVTFHEPIDPREFADRDALILAVEEAVRSSLPEKYRRQP